MGDLNGTKRSPLVLALVVVTTALPQMSQATEKTSACPRTPPSGQILGKPFPQSENWYGTEALAVILPKDSLWRGMGAPNHYRDKLFWWSSGFEPGRESQLSVTGRRIDGDSRPANISSTTNAYAPSLGGWAMLVAAEFPGPGCWEITGRYLSQELKFVVEIPAAE